jgi:hypothetical protein
MTPLLADSSLFFNPQTQPLARLADTSFRWMLEALPSMKQVDNNQEGVDAFSSMKGKNHENTDETIQQRKT